MTSPQAAFDRFPEPDRATAWLGLEVVETGPRHAVTRMRVREEMLNGFGITHGGMVFALADSTFALACNGDEAQTGMVAVNCEIDYLRPTRAGDLLVATASAQYQGRNSGIYCVDVVRRTEDGDQSVALFRGRCRAMKS